MSYILDALRKAERERGSARVPSLAGANEDRGQRRGRLAIMTAGFLVLAIAFLILFRSSLTTIFQASPGLTERNQGSIQQGKAREPEGSATGAAESPDSSAGEPPSRQQGSPRPGFTDTKPAAGVTAPRLPEAAQNPPEGGQHPGPVRTVPSREISEPAAARTAEPVEQPGTSPESAAQKETSPAPSVAEAAAVLEEAVARMNLNILLYEEAEGDRRVFINGKKYMKGDLVEGKYLVESITQDGALLSYEGARALLRLH